MAGSYLSPDLDVCVDKVGLYADRSFALCSDKGRVAFFPRERVKRLCLADESNGCGEIGSCLPLAVAADGEPPEVFSSEDAKCVLGGVCCREKDTNRECYPQPFQLTHTKPELPDGG